MNLFILQIDATDTLVDGIKSVIESANTYITWAMSIIGGSLLALLSTSYIKPIKGNAKKIYLLFIIGWIFLGLTIYYGDMIVRSGIMVALNHDLAPANINTISNFYGCLLTTFHWGVVVFGFWLLCYIFWFIFYDSEKINTLTKNQNED